MNLLGCTGEIMIENGMPVCSGEWLAYASTIALDAESYQELWHWALLLLVTASCIKLIKNLILNK